MTAINAPSPRPKGYKHPPVTEAVIGINFANNLSRELLRSASDKLAKNYPIHQDLQTVNLDLKLSNLQDQGTVTPRLIEGHRRSSQDMTELALTMPTSLLVSQLAPYPSWETFSKRFARDWKLVKKAFGFQEMKRIGLRYINRIDIPIPGDSVIKHEEYLNVFPQVPDLLSPLHASAVQTVSYFEDIDCRLVLNWGVVPSPILNHCSFILDLDLFRDSKVPQSDKTLFELLDVMRLKKNEVFEACVTQRARNEIFNGDRDGK